jgi:hypothetical protein
MVLRRIFGPKGELEVVAFPGILFGGVSTNSVEERG